MLINDVYLRTQNVPILYSLLNIATLIYNHYTTSSNNIFTLSPFQADNRLQVTSIHS